MKTHAGSRVLKIGALKVKVSPGSRRWMDKCPFCLGWFVWSESRPLCTTWILRRKNPPDSTYHIIIDFYTIEVPKFPGFLITTILFTIYMLLDLLTFIQNSSRCQQQMCLNVILKSKSNWTCNFKHLCTYMEIKADGCKLKSAKFKMSVRRQKNRAK